MPIDTSHVARIQAVLRLLADIEPARAALVLEDAYVACLAGLSFGLTMPEIVEHGCAVIDEIVSENGTRPPAGHQG